MKCSECSNEVKPVVAIDIDGTLGDYHRHFLRFAGNYLGGPSTGLDLLSYDGSETFKGWFCHTRAVNEDTFREIKLAYRQGGMKRSMPIFDNAAESCRHIREQGAELWITTTRPYLRLDNVDPDTQFWLQRHRIGYDFMLYDGYKYARLAELVDPDRVVAVVDDLSEHIVEAEKAFGWDVPILKKNGYNNALAGENDRMSLWAIALDIGKRIDAWKAKND